MRRSVNNFGIIQISYRTTGMALAAEEDSLMAVASALAAEDSSAMDSIDMSYRQSTRSMIVPAMATTKKHPFKVVKSYVTEGITPYL